MCEPQKTCNVCHESIPGDAVWAMQKLFHPDCFKCAHCRRQIKKEYSVKDSDTYCKECFKDCFGDQLGKCSGCSEPVDGECVEAGEKQYHKDCFRCFKCKAPFNDGKFYMLNDKTKDNDPYCKDCFKESFGNQLTADCAGCGEPIAGECIGAGQRQYHKDCFKCSKCNVEFTDGKYYMLNKKIEDDDDPYPYCKECFEDRYGDQLVGGQCDSCHEPLDGECVEAEGENYHTDCFRCSECNALLTGGKYYVVDDKRYCLDDHWFYRTKKLLEQESDGQKSDTSTFYDASASD